MACARSLRRAGCFVEVFERDKMIGGRLGTARLGLVPFDHGAQYLASRSDRFRAFVDELVQTGYAAPWSPVTATPTTGTEPFRPSWHVGTPAMASIVRPLAEGVRVHTQHSVHTLQRQEKGWHLWFEDQTSTGPFAAVAVCVPAAEARLLVGRYDHLIEPLSRVKMSPCWSILVRLDERVLPQADVYSDMSQLIRWIGRNNVKPGRTRGRGEHLVIHTAPQWTRETIDADPELVAEEVWLEVCNVLDLPPVRPVQMAAVLWQHGLVDASLGESYIYSSKDKVGLAGDWCLGRLAEHAYDSGLMLGRAIVDSLT